MPVAYLQNFFTSTIVLIDTFSSFIIKIVYLSPIYLACQCCVDQRKHALSTKDG